MLLRAPFVVLILLSSQAFAENGEPPEETEESGWDGERDLSPDIVAKLNAEQIASILEAREEAENGGSVAWLSSLAFFVVVLGSVAGSLLAYVRVQKLK